MDFFHFYIDDVLIASNSPQEHQQHLQLIFERFQKYNIVINPAKCEFGASKLQFLGHLVTPDGVYPLPDRVRVIQEFPVPNSLKKLREFLGIVSFYRRFLPRCANILRPLNDFLKAHHKDFSWSTAAATAFEQAKDLLAKATLLNHPTPDAPTCMCDDRCL